MSDRIYAGTRKGLFTFERSGADDWKMARVSFLGEPVSITLCDPRDGALYAALNLGHFGVKLHRSDDGVSFSEITAPHFPGQPPTVADETPWTVEQIWSLACGDGDSLWAGTIPGGLFRSDDRGESWQLNTALWDDPRRLSWTGGGYDYPGIHSICVDPRDPRCVTVAVSIGGVWHTTNAGESWEPRTEGMFAVYVPPDLRSDPSSQDPHLVDQCASSPDVLWSQHHNGVFRSADRGLHWKELAHVPPSVFGFAVASHPGESETAWFVPAVKDECRVPVDGRLVVARTHDGGETFETLSRGLPQEHCYDLVYRHALAVDADGRRLAMGSTTGNLWISEDAGDHWQRVSANLPPIASLRFAP